MTLIYGQLNWDRGRAFAASAKPQSPEQSPARATIARLRAFSLLLCMDTKIANELVEITLVRASVSTDLSHLNPSHLAWLISRLRSYFYAKYAHRQVPVGPRPPLFAVTWQRHGDLLAALSGLTVEQREALIPDRSRRVVLQGGRANLPPSLLDLQEVRRAGACRPCPRTIRQCSRDHNHLL
jgi:hypothetical protein